MSKKSFDDWLNSYGVCDCNEECLAQAWNFCASQYESEVEELKLKFSEATKTYTDDIDGLEKENDELKKKLEEAVFVMKSMAHFSGDDDLHDFLRRNEL